MQKDNYIFRLDARYAKNNLISIIIIFLPCAALVFYAIATADDLVFEVKTLYFIIFGIAVFIFLLEAFAIFRIDKVFLTENSIVVQKNSKNLEFLYADIKFVIRKEFSDTIVLKSVPGDWVLYKCKIVAWQFRRLYAGSSNCVRILLKLSYKRIQIVL